VPFKIGLYEYSVKKIDRELAKYYKEYYDAAVQDGFNIYHHLMIVSENNWGIIQQGLDGKIKKARRYHWLSEGLPSYLDDPHNDISTEVVKENVLDMASYESRKGRDISLDLIQEGPNRLKRYFNMLKDKNQKS